MHELGPRLRLLRERSNLSIRPLAEQADVTAALLSLIASILWESIVTDIENPKLLWTKGVLFLAIGVVSSVLLLLDTRSLKVAMLLALAVWGFCRAYYFAFYVIEHYADPAYRFAGLIPFIRYACGKRAGK